MPIPCAAADPVIRQPKLLHPLRSRTGEVGVDLDVARQHESGHSRPKVARERFRLESGVVMKQDAQLDLLFAQIRRGPLPLRLPARPGA